MSKVYVFNRYGGPESQELIDRPVPEPGPGELGVEVRAAAVNPVDWQLRSGHVGLDQELPVPMGREAGTHQVELQAGQTLLILGIGGGVGLMAAQIGKVHEFTVVGVASESKRDIVESEAMAKITDVIKYGLVHPHVFARFPLERAGEAIAAVESDHATGKVIVEMVSA